MGGMTRTQWLLVALMGLIAWIVGYTMKVPLFGFPGAVAFLVGVGGAAFGGKREA